MKPLVEKLKKKGYLRNKSLERAFLKIRREEFIPFKLKSLAVKDKPLPIGEGQTISQPAVVAFMMEMINPEKGDIILDIGSGSGWTTAILAEMVGESGKVCAIEKVEDLYEFGKENVNKFGFISNGRVDMVLGDGFEGLPESSPFDKILVSAALDSEPIPESWVDQLKEGGVIVVPIKNSIYKYVKKRDKLMKEEFPGFRFVPLVKKEDEK